MLCETCHKINVPISIMLCIAVGIGKASSAETSRSQAEEGTGKSGNPTKALAMLLSSANPSSAFSIGGTRAPGSQLHTRSQTPLMSSPPRFDVKEMAGVTAPLGFFDPAGFTTDASEGKIRFYREVELKHGRIGMLAALGFLVAEQFHPLFGGNIDVPAYSAFQETPLQTFWGLVVLAIAIPEVFSVFSFNSPLGGEPWSVRSDHEPGNIGFDPLNLKPTDPKELKEMQTKELNNGRLAMLAAAGMIAQELASGKKLF